MAYKIAFQMDPLENLNITKDSTLLIAHEAARRGYEIYHFTPNKLSWSEGEVVAEMRPFQVHYNTDPFYSYGTAERKSLEGFDLVLMRQDPPFDLNYIAATHLLEHVTEKTLALNDPASVRNAPEKMLVTYFPDFIPPTLISRDLKEIEAFREKHKDIVLKPLNGFAGHNIFHIRQDSENLTASLSALNQIYNEPHVIQKYIPEIRKGDKRILLFDGKPVACLLRVPQTGNARANFAHGGVGTVTELTKRDKEICEAIGPALLEKKLTLAGIDVIGDYLTEINVTCPTGLVHIKNLYDREIEVELWDLFDQKIKDFKKAV